MITKIQKGHPEDVKRKRIMRIKEAIDIKLGTEEEPNEYVIGMINDNKVYFKKPGKEYFRKEGKRNINDMTPCVGNLYDRYSFGNIWKDMLNLSVRISKDSYKKLNVLLYRLAYLMDCSEIDGKIRYNPTGEVYDIIKNIQREIDLKKYNFKVLEFINFIDILSWNEDVKYQAECKFETPKKGRINTVLSLISIPLMFKEFVDLVIEKKDYLHELDYSILIDVANNFSRTRGVQPISNRKLVEYLAPYLSE